MRGQYDAVIDTARNDLAANTAADPHKIGINLVDGGFDRKELLRIGAVAGAGPRRDSNDGRRKLALRRSIESQSYLLSLGKANGVILRHE